MYRDGKAKDCYGYGDPLPSHGLCSTVHIARRNSLSVEVRF